MSLSEKFDLKKRCEYHISMSVWDYEASGDLNYYKTNRYNSLHYGKLGFARLLLEFTKHQDILCFVALILAILLLIWLKCKMLIINK